MEISTGQKYILGVLLLSPSSLRQALTSKIHTRLLGAKKAYSGRRPEDPFEVFAQALRGCAAEGGLLGAEEYLMQLDGLDTIDLGFLFDIYNGTNVGDALLGLVGYGGGTCPKPKDEIYLIKALEGHDLEKG